MELLNGKAKELFLEYYWQTKIEPLPMTICKREDLAEFFETVVDIFKYALIIEWLDSVGIYIEFEVIDAVDLTFNYAILCNNNFRGQHGRNLRIGNRNYKNRQEATTEAINKAVILINEDDRYRQIN